MSDKPKQSREPEGGADNTREAEHQRVRAALESSQARLEAIISAAMDAIISINAEQRVVLFNAAAEKLFGVPAREALGQSINRFIPERFRSAHTRDVAAFGQTGTTARRMGALGALTALRANGEEFPIEASISQVEVGGEKLFTVILRDISERKQREEQLRLQAAALEAAANAIFLTDRTGAIQWANPAFERLTGYSAAEVLGKNPRFLKSERQQDPGFFRQMWETILAGQVWHGELVNQRKDGSRYHEEMTITPVRDSAGVITHFIAIKQDVTERREAEEARAKLAAVVEFSGDAILSKDLQGIVTSWNRAAQRLLGWAPEEIIGKSINLIIPPELEQEETAILERLRQGASVEHYETIRVSKTGRRIEVLVTIAPVRNESGQVVGACKTIRDITDRKEAERALRRARDELQQANADLERRVAERTAKLQEAMTEMEQMSYSMIHDLRAPLRAIQSFGEIVVEDPENRLSQESRELVTKMRNAANRMDHLVCDVLNYSKVVQGELPLSPVEAGPLVRGIVETYPNLQPPNSEVTVAPDLPRVMANVAALTQCLSHLLSNAVKFAKPGQPAKVQVKAERDDNGWVRLIVEDDGIGIAPQYQGKVFGMFQRLNTTAEGTGMGLAVVKKTAERMGGRVGVESEPEKGSRFWLELKAADGLKR